MPADSPSAQRAPVTIRDPTENLFTCHSAPLRELGQRLARLEDRLLCAARRDFERDRDLPVGESAQLAHYQRASLAVGQLAEIGYQQREMRPLAGSVLGRGRLLRGM